MFISGELTEVERTTSVRKTYNISTKVTIKIRKVRTSIAWLRFLLQFKTAWMAWRVYCIFSSASLLSLLRRSGVESGRKEFLSKSFISCLNSWDSNIER